MSCSCRPAVRVLVKSVHKGFSCSRVQLFSHTRPACDQVHLPLFVRVRSFSQTAVCFASKDSTPRDGDGGKKGVGEAGGKRASGSGGSGKGGSQLRCPKCGDPCTQQQGRISSDPCISRLAVDKHVYVSKRGGHTVEVWDKKTERMVNLIDCAQLLGLSSAKKPKAQSEDQSRQMVPSSAIVKALLVQHSGTLWIGTKSGHILLVEVSSCQLLQTISAHCHSIRCMGSVLLDTLNRKNVILVLGRRQRMPQDQIKTQVPAEDSVLTVWSSSLPREIRDLIRHCELRDKITSKMRETLHN